MAAVLSTPREKQFTPDPLLYPTAQRYFLHGPGLSIKPPVSIHSDYSSTDYLSPISSPVSSSIPSSPTSSSLSPSVDDEHDGDDEIVFPSYDANDVSRKDPSASQDLQSEQAASEGFTTPLTKSQRWCLKSPAADDTSLEDEPSRHVDYLSHEWREEDIWSSWRYVTTHTDAYSNGPRLENASWRMWTKLKYGLGTISPEKLNWLKDCDVTWLYGPLKTSKALGSSTSPPPTRLETPNFYQDRKPILKKKTASETMLQRSLSQHTLLQHAGAILKAKEARNTQDLSGIHSSPNQSGSTTPTVTAGTPTTASPSDIESPSGRRHIHFNNEVVQCIAVEAKDEGEMDEGGPTTLDDGLSSDEAQVSPNACVSNIQCSRNSFCHENKTIAPLPSTTLKYRGDTPEPAPGSFMARWFGARSSALPSLAPSVGSYQPPGPSVNFLLDDDDDGLDIHWKPKRTSEDFARERSSSFVGSKDDELELDQDLDLTSSDMFTSGDWESPNASIVDRVTDTVNTAKDIAHVIWNVGWRR